jgi:hypothetical protein
VRDRLHRLAAQRVPKPRRDRAKIRVLDDRLSRSTRPLRLPTSTMHPGRADMTPMRSASIVASSSAWVMRKTVAPVPATFAATRLHQEPRLLIERPEGLVEQNEPRLHHQRAGDADTLAHAPKVCAG